MSIMKIFQENTPNANMADHSDGPGRVARKRGYCGPAFPCVMIAMAASRALTEDDIPGASLAGRSPATLKNEELRFWLKCRGDSLKGLKTKALLVKR